MTENKITLRNCGQVPAWMGRIPEPAIGVEERQFADKIAGGRHDR